MRASPAAAVLAKSPAEGLIPYFERPVGLTTWDLEGLPDLRTLWPQKSELRRWFEARGVPEIAAALSARGDNPDEALFVMDDGVSLQRVMEAAAACIAAGIEGFRFHLPGDFEPWVADPRASVCLDGVPVRAAR